MAKKIIGFRGRGAREKALHRSSLANPNPSVHELYDGCFVGAGETVVRPDGTRDIMLYGARGTSTWASEVQS